MTGKDLLLLLLYVPGKTGECCEKIEGRTLLQKMVFLFKNEVYEKHGFKQLIEPEDFPDFKPCDSGPFSCEVFDDLDFFTMLGFVDAFDSNEEAEEEEADEYQLWEEQTGLGEDFGVEKGFCEFRKEAYVLTETGRAFVEKELWPRLNECQRQACRS
ncbi:hypothetical protein MTAT_29410 [Moorella thermoacetica]|uniref:Antitoxin SocA-like Panacea domain-containing protein n=1 Tax=Neomoorella thermoacetica TaxID=1525 RepID=A0AAC9MT32_NEOTH|nr:hypothetical protein [Moorella thermoacetica]AOQ23023.1 hypothetical protein Maut_00556 [Moorella thermoacetica]TYL07265.1 hypothetical protein MTAT_29410 [Moorella thermoacetica]